MATITKSIGTSSRDYSTITAWEADLDNTGIYTSGDDAVGECYNDTAFDESVTISGGVSGLNLIKLTVASGEKHDGTEGSGARIVKTSGNAICIQFSSGQSQTIIENLECDANGRSTTHSHVIGITGGALGSGSSVTTRGCIVHGDNTQNGSHYGIYVYNLGSTGAECYIENNIIYDIEKAYGGGTDSAYGIAETIGFPSVFIYNNTIYKITGFGAGNTYGIYASDDAVNTVRNNICIDCNLGTNTGTKQDYFISSPSNSTMTNNISSDSTASGTGSLTNKTAANQFVSTVAGSEDLHLLSTADAVGAGVDLATTSIDINGSDRNALAATIWDIGAHQYASTASIGTSSRDYSTIALWEADLDDTTIYGAGANAVGECYNDSTFTANARMDGGGTVGLNSVKLTAAAGNGHDGTAGTGAKFVSQAWYQTLSGGDNVRVTVSLLEIDYNSQRVGSLSGRGAGTGFGNTYNRLLLYNGDMHGSVFYYDFASMDISNNIIYNMSGSRGQFVVRTTSSATSYITNNTAYNIQGGYGISNGYYLRLGSTICKNCIAIDVVGDCFVYNGSPVAEYNISSDGTATGTGSQTNKSAANQFVSTLSGSEDLHIVETSDAFGAGVDLGTVVDGVQYDIDGQNRDTFVGTTWDIGADQVKTPASIGTSSRDYSTITAWEADLDDTSLYTSGDDAVGECYNDSTFALTDHIILRGGGTVGLSSVTVTAAQADRHDGTADTGVKITFNSFKAFYAETGKDASTRIPTIVEWLDIDGQGFNRTFLITFYDNTLNSALRNCITRGPGDQVNAYLQSYNNIAYGSSGGFLTNANFGNRNVNQYNNTIHLPVAYRVTYIGTGTVNIKNILATSDNPHPTYGLFSGDYLSSANNASNISSDGTAIGTNSKTNQPVSKQFVSTLSGSEDLHLIFKSAAIDAGVDLGTTPDGVQYDINGKDRDTENSIWDIGAHEYGDNVVFGLLRV